MLSANRRVSNSNTNLYFIYSLSFYVQFVTARALMYFNLLFLSFIIKGAVSVCKMDLRKDELGDKNSLASKFI